ncbi:MULTISPECIES: EAL domain-containing protein [Cyanophyceae]|uniref:EAL domain-containing protein n=1 Tax=Leptolyngbya subtilissima DQ-A4 TaxID=2933933 RepID=A0ABV0K9F9_9CYAN|nr:EAL domain-containing protein [Nodosilinea sp. FACHB-141]MBD2114289.1 EAL domain-containing protein [Nodosilinea sp. FACHB-141]
MPPFDCTVLVISDADVTASSLQNLLEQADQGLGQVLAVGYDGPILELCHAHNLRLIFLDADRSDTRKFDCLKQLKAHLGDRCPPIVAIGPNEANMATQALKAGATDYWVQERLTPPRLRQALEALPWADRQPAIAELDAFRVTLSDALRALADPIEIQVTASRILGEYLNASRTLYFECRNDIYCVERDYTSGVATIAGCYPVTAFGLAIFSEFCAGRSVVVADVGADPRLSPAERATYASVQIVAYMGIPLVKDGNFVAGLAVHSSTPRIWTQAEVNLAEETAERTWAAVERARAEVALNQSEEKYRTLFQNIDQGFCLLELIFDEQGQAVDFRCLETNPAFVKHAGQPMAGKRIRELVPGFEQIWIDTYGQVALTGKSVRLEHVVKGLGDQWFETSAFRYGGAGSRIVAVLFTNITDRKQAELSLKDSEEQFRLLSEISPVGIFRNDIHGQCTYANAKTLEITGLSLEKNLGGGWGKYLHPDDRDWMYAAWSTFVEQTRLGQPATYYVEHRFLYQDGSLRWVLGQAVPEHNAQGELVGFIGTVTDITDRKQAQEKLTRELNRSKALLEGSSDGIVVLNLQGYVVAANESYARMLGRTLEDTLTLHVSDWDAQWSPAELNHIVASRQFVGRTFETVHRRQDGSIYNVEVTVSAVDTDDEFLHLCICRDISERKRHEANAAFLAEVTVDLSRLTTAEEIMQTTGAKLGAYLQLSDCSFVVLDHIAQEATITYDWHLENGIPLTGVYRLCDFLTPDFLRDTRDGKPFVVCDTETDPRTNAANYASLNIHAFCTVSFHQDGQLRSLLAIYDVKPRQWRADEIELVGELTNQIFPRLERARADAALQRYNETLEARVAERTAELSQSLTALQQSEERLHHLAHHDPLTGLPNRLWLNLHLEQSIQQATRQQTKLAVLFVDLDRFKHINDSLGHRAGDGLLQQLGDRLRQGLRTNDCIARISGDEFVVVLEDVKDVAHIGTAISRLMTVFEAPFKLEGQTVHMTSSIGISLFPDDSSEAATLLRYADTAMYEAKEEGRNTYRFYAEEMTATAFEHVLFGNALRNALQQHELHLVYQPQINLQSQQWVGLEVLLRWQHPELGEISPAQFIPIAEQSGLIHEIGTWVLQSACCQAKTWLDSGLDLGRIAVNVAASQLNHENFVQVVEDVLRKSGLPPSHLELEVTERLVMQRTEAKIQQLKQLRQLGIQIAIDDFGTGYSSLSYLKLLPIDKLKIDKSFVCDIPHDANDMAIAAAVIALGQALGMTIIAEGVEQEAQVAFLKLKGCHEAQGYLYSQPLRPEIVPEIWNRRHQSNEASLRIE